MEEILGRRVAGNSHPLQITRQIRIQNKCEQRVGCLFRTETSAFFTTQLSEKDSRPFPSAWLVRKKTPCEILPHGENLYILHAVRNLAVEFLAIVPSPPQLIFQLYTSSTGERARVRGKNPLILVHHINTRSTPSSGLSATFSPDSGEKGLGKR